MTEHTHFPNMRISLAMYSSTIRRITSDNWRRKWISEEVKEFGSIVCEFKKRSLDVFSMHTRSIHDEAPLIDHLVEEIRKSGDISVLNTFLISI